MPNEMNHAEIAKKLLYLDSNIESDEDVRALSAAASIVRKVANAEYVPAPVKCSECVEWEEKDGIFPICRLRSKSDFRPHKDGFCDMGERKDGEK